MGASSTNVGQGHKKGIDMAKKKKKIKENKGSSNEEAFIITAGLQQPTFLYGNVKVTGNEVRINMKKKRSKKRIERVFNTNQLLGYAAGLEEEGAFVIANTNAFIVDDVFSNVEVDDNGCVKATSANGLSCVFFSGPGKLDVNCSYETDPT